MSLSLQESDVLELPNVLLLAKRARELMREEPNVLNLTSTPSSPIVVSCCIFFLLREVQCPFF